MVTPASGGGSTPAPTRWLRGLWEYYREYTGTAIHTAAAAALAIFGLLIFIDPLFAAIAIASYVCPPLILYTLDADVGKRSEGAERIADGARSGRGSSDAASGIGGGDADSDGGDGDTDSDRDDGDTDSDRNDGDTDSEGVDTDTDADGGDSDADTDGWRDYGADAGG